MPNAAWKSVERRVCAFLGCVRTGPTGDSGPDCTCKDSLLAIQIKHREGLPEWLLGMVHDTIQQAGEGRYPILVLYPKGYETGQALAILPLKYMRELLVQAGQIDGTMEPILKEEKNEHSD